MRKATLPLLLSIALCAAAATPQPAPRHVGKIRLIIQGDDMGAAHSINLATIKAYKEGILRTTNVIVPGPWFLDAVEMLKQNPGLEVGVHLCLTSEWQRVKWRPLTAAPSLADADGYFFPMVWPNKLFPPGASLKEAAPKDDEVERELRAQVETLKRHIPRVAYLSTHMGFNSLKPEWRAIVERVSASTGVPPMGGPGVNYLGGVWRSGAGEAFDNASVRAAKLAKRLETITPGTWLMVDHCGLDDAEMQAIGHAGYEYVAADRAAVTAAWTDPKVIEVVKRRGIELVGNASVPRVASE
jgi:predicted glycoside hydrolase/deacetylase ChbG (UPF0249 family)